MVNWTRPSPCHRPIDLEMLHPLGFNTTLIFYAGFESLNLLATFFVQLLMPRALIGVHSIAKIGCHYFWPGLIAPPKNTLPIGLVQF
jgi:hypothetical protein